MAQKPETQEKKFLLYGEIESLSDPVPWTQGLSNLFEHITWTTSAVLGVSKSTFRNMAVELAVGYILERLTASNEEKKKLLKIVVDDTDCSEDTLDDLERKLRISVKKYVKDDLDRKTTKDIRERNESKAGGLIGAHEALRQIRFFSEDYLNKEFDIFLSLVSSAYLDNLYYKFFKFEQGNQWFTQGNSALFGNSLNVDSVQMDNIAYNPSSKLLIGNELKLDGRKNDDQILKYCYLYLKLKEKQFIGSDNKFCLLFFSERSDLGEVEAAIDSEIRYCQRLKKTPKWFVQYEGQLREIAKQTEITLVTWKELIEFNEEFESGLSEREETFRKLLLGFNESLKQKPSIASTLD